MNEDINIRALSDAGKMEKLIEVLDTLINQLKCIDDEILKRLVEKKLMVVRKELNDLGKVSIDLTINDAEFLSELSGRLYEVFPSNRRLDLIMWKIGQKLEERRKNMECAINGKE